MVQVLLVEADQGFGALVRGRLLAELGVGVTWTTTLTQTAAALRAADEPFLVAVVDMNLPGCRAGGALDAVVEAGTRVLALASDDTDETRDAVWSRKAVDWIPRGDPQAVDLVVDRVRRLARNHEIQILVVDDARASRVQVADLLAVQRYVVLEAGSGPEALDILAANPDVALVLVDDRMPGMDGLELVRRIRRVHRRDRLAIVGMAAQGAGGAAARLLRAGANDVLCKPVLPEELLTRVEEPLLDRERLDALEALAMRDRLTGLHARPYFLDAGEKLCANARRGNLSVGVAAIDVDHLARINGTHGLDAGDEVLRRVGAVLAGRFRESDLLARLGAGRFAVLSTNMDPAHAVRIYDDVRRSVEALEVRPGDRQLRVTVSIGVCRGPNGRIEHLLGRAERQLQHAKDTGRNRVSMEG